MFERYNLPVACDQTEQLLDFEISFLDEESLS